jgi:hypothetical protein
MKRSKEERQAYAQRRMSLAIDRQIVASDEPAKQQARRWVLAWARLLTRG